MLLHKARKRFGQNFLIDNVIIDKILASFSPQAEDFVIEIGPGLSAITKPLSCLVNKLTCIEIDRDLVRVLKKKFDNCNVCIIEADALKFDFNQFNCKARVIGNLPYNISTQLLFRLMEFDEKIIDGYFMLQREVVERMISRPSSSNYGRLSVMLQERYKIEKLFDISPSSFNPEPKVFSSFVRLIPLSVDRIKPINYDLFSKVVSQSFSQKRKILSNSLGEWSNYIPWDKLNISPKSRAENISVHEFIEISDILYEYGFC
ncbi:dimethyladenosine transferase [Candidatus Kinetoplastibacterium desouzaii TCC079E]|uniref:Ribosomal RNA small subunit methyltransferase A n=1 Tax=Candidatus Kinetoplastidibacterium desouzai TCC079E TaxID=1208919 RepID=M1LR80_9PROT|nr:16S rRNA (adenine(1518)-N(6)/adenine(1519)-N(6))-dimethyltransferase RsmA [Candidatus Kinetoplastibacterium desouzaii]AGF46666.1 dimethyladenosine transferase [Candidatus Kinetoplastibacterium desouzaii TCC079E]